MTISLAPRLAACLKKVAATGWLVVGRAPMTMMHSALSASVNGADTAPEPTPSMRAATDEAWQSLRAMVDVVGAEALAHQLLEEVGLLVGSLGRAEAGQRTARHAREDLLQAAGGALQRLFPGGFAEDGQRIDAAQVGRRRDFGASSRRIRGLVSRSGDIDIVEAEAALDAQTVLVGVTVAAVDLDDPVVLDGDARLAADAADTGRAY